MPYNHPLHSVCLNSTCSAALFDKVQSDTPLFTHERAPVQVIFKAGSATYPKSEFVLSTRKKLVIRAYISCQWHLIVHWKSKECQTLVTMDFMFTLRRVVHIIINDNTYFQSSFIQIIPAELFYLCYYRRTVWHYP